MKDVEHSDQPDPLKRAHPEQFRPEIPAPHDGAEVINATKATRDLRKLAELAGGPIDELKEI
jgi:hypothetical protein